MPADTRETLLRLWEILKHLPRYPSKVTASEITGRLAKSGLEVEKRTIERDLIKLSRVFPVVCDERSKPFGWAWAKDAAAFSLPGLATSEALSLCLVERYLSGLLPNASLEFLQPHFREAHRKLGNPVSRPGHRSWLDKVRVLPPTQPRVPPTIDAAVQKTMYDALLDEREVKISYRHRGSSEPKGYRVWPLTIVQRGQVMHVVAKLPEEEIIRRFALNRIVSAETTDKKFDYPKNYDPDQWLSEGNLGFGGSEKAMVILEFQQEAGEPIVERPLAEDQRTECLPDGKIRISSQLVINRQLIWWILGYGNQVEVIAPDSLRTAIGTTAEVVANIYRK